MPKVPMRPEESVFNPACLHKEVPTLPTHYNIDPKYGGAFLALDGAVTDPA